MDPSRLGAVAQPFHWLLETPEANLVAGMHWFQSTYSTRFRTRNRLVGHVLQGRYKAILIQPDSDDYFQTVSTYIHLHPVRAKGLLGPEAALTDYRWSSYPHYLMSPQRRPGSLQVERVLGNLHLRDNRTGRRKYGEHMAERCREERSANRKKELDAQWKELRRGWCLGEEAFRDKMLDRLDDVLKGRSRGSLCGGELREHNERAALREMERALTALELSRAQLPTLRKTDARKRVAAWWVRSRTTVSNGWVAEQLHMGHPMNASASVRLVREARGNELARIRRRLENTLAL